MDLLPTICRLAGVEPPKRLDGHDIHLTLRGGKKAVYHRTLVWDTHHETAVRHENWKLKTAKRNRHARYEMVEVELGTFLYDLAKDPGEKECMAKEHPEVVEKLLAIHRTWRAKIGE